VVVGVADIMSRKHGNKKVRAVVDSSGVEVAVKIRISHSACSL
jgi:hypothetical protein